jgi:hypothetical protein
MAAVSKVCIECGHQVPTLFKLYGGSQLGNIRLAQCDQCHEFVDKYLEFDLIVIFLDLVLLKKAAYRHMVFNRLSFDHRGLNVAALA